MSTQTQKVAVITGASQGIGAGLVVAYRKLGYAVVATSRSIAASQDPEILTVQGDIADRATAERIITAGLERFGRIDTLVNNAGIFISNAFTDFSRNEYDAVLGVNLTGFFRITQLAIQQMLTQGGGHVVQITSTLADRANSNVNSVLAALTKGGLQSATRALAIEYATRGIRSNAIALGTIKTPMTEGYWDVLAGLHPVGRLGEVSDVVDAAIYLENAPFVTGEILHVDGGQIAGH
ncbi:SDR family oxidoreductase [Streptomyces sp. NPDC004546]|uniref:SDR family NAD(P)-dependent oxidoreductase n=1 Tax=unclassified Streptomyces TaxID=2593676 RepID=UPI0033B0180E